MPDILDHADFDLLAEMEKERIREAMKNPEERIKFLAGVVFVQRKEGLARQVACEATCKPALHRRLGRLERFQAWILGVGIALVFAVGTALTVWGLLA